MIKPSPFRYFNTSPEIILLAVMVFGSRSRFASSNTCCVSGASM
jgi:hypothetical protein